MIEDKELRDLFKIESEEHLQKLSDGLLRLEKEPKDAKTLDEVFREAHSLKGAARMVGVTGVETIAHRIEDILGAAKKGETVLSSETIDRLYKGLDSMRKLVNEAVTGEAANIKISDVIAQIEGTGVVGAIHELLLQSSESIPPSPQSSPVKGEEEKRKSEEVPSPIVPSPPAGEGKGEGVPPSPPSKFRIETVRVDTKMLDMLMTQAGELTVTKTHLTRRLSEIEEISELWEELEKKVGAYGNTPLQSKIQNLKSQLGADSARLDFITDKIGDGIRKIRLIPLSTIFNLYPRMVRDMARERSKEVNLVIEGGETVADKRIIEEMKDPLMHMIRNSIDHGIERPDERERIGKPHAGTITLKAYQTPSNIVIEVSDDGNGLDMETIKRAALKRNVIHEEKFSAMTAEQIESLIFTSGFSTSSFISEISGRGVGLDVVRTNVDRLKGTISVGSSPGAGCSFRVQLPVTLATVRVLIASSDGRSYAIPVEYIETSRMVSIKDIFPIAGRSAITFDGRPVSVARLADLLEIQLPPVKRGSEGAFPCIILSVKNERLGVLVDAMLDEQEVVLKTQSAILKNVRNVSGATILATGEVCMVLNPPDMIKSVRKFEAPAAPEKSAEEVRKKSVLLVEDSITTRTQEKRILEGAGYETVTAVDGLDALNKLSSRPFDAVVSDILMPNMDGLTLTEKIRSDKKYKELPVILVTSLATDEDKKRGIEVGANAYITKPTFDQKDLLDILRRLV